MMSNPAPLWAPSAQRVAAAAMTAFRTAVAARYGVELADSVALHRFSIERPGDFWPALWDFTGVVGDRGERAFVPGEHMRDARFFPDGTLNVVDTLLRTRDDSPAILAAREDGERSALTWRELRERVGAAAHGLRASGVGPGDVVAAWLPNIPQAFVTALAAASIGAIYTSTSPDFGVTGVLDRFGQVRPKVLVAADGYVYAGKSHDCLARLREIRDGLPSLKKVVVVPYLADAPTLRGLPNSGHVAGVSARQGTARANPAAVRRAPVRALLIRHDRRAEVHRPSRRRAAPRFAERASAALRHQAGGPRLLLHDDRLDDVELAAWRAGVEGHPRRVRRLAGAPLVVRAV